MRESEFRYLPEEMREKNNENVLVALVHEDVSFIKTLFDELKPVRVHLIIQDYVRGPDFKDYLEKYRGEIYSSLLGRDVSNFQKTPSSDRMDVYGFDIIEHPVSQPYHYHSMVSVVNDILYDESGNLSKVYLSILGTPVYVAAAATVVPRYPNSTLYTCMAQMGNLPERERANTHNGRLCGAYGNPGTPWEVFYIPREPVDLNLLRAFKLYCSIEPSMRTNANVVRTLVYNGLWHIWKRDAGYTPMIGLNRENLDGRLSVSMENIDHTREWLSDPHLLHPEDEAEYRAIQKKESVELMRHYFEKWYAFDWLINESGGSRRSRSFLRIRSTGINHIDMFCSDSIYLVKGERICPSGAYMRYTKNDTHCGFTEGGGESEE